jgi:molecular chaperone HtpG
MAMKQFQTESKKLMDLMINSIYTNKEIFLRELISNASDAIDKLYFKSLTDTSVGMNKDDFRIMLTADKENRLLTISDNGIGMNKDELEENLGTIAHSGSQAFKSENKDENIDIIGQFGVGFYSAFMVADKVTVTSRAYGSDEAWQWSSSGAEGYELEPAEKDSVGTEIVLHIKPDTETEHYDNYLDEYGIVAIVKKYSDYVRYPIQMYREKSRQKPEPDPKPEDYKPEWETYTELETLNSMIPIWKKQKSEVTDAEYNEFYKSKFNDYVDPSRVIVSRTEGTANYNALLFVPSHRPYDYYTKEYEKGLALYASGVLIMEKCGDLLPDYFSFVKGIVDSQDLNLNISREMLQQDNQLRLIHNALEKKIKNELRAMLLNDREKYEAFWKEFGRQIKFGAYSDYGMHADLLRDLLLFYSAKEKKMVTLEEYVEKMPAEQKYIYFAAGDSTDRLAKLPSAELVLDKGYDLLLLTEDVDEFCLQIMRTAPRKDAEGKDGTVEFKNINSGDLGLESDE